MDLTFDGNKTRNPLPLVLKCNRQTFDWTKIRPTGYRTVGESGAFSDNFFNFNFDKDFFL